MSSQNTSPNFKLTFSRRAFNRLSLRTRLASLATAFALCAAIIYSASSASAGKQPLSTALARTAAAKLNGLTRTAAAKSKAPTARSETLATGNLNIARKGHAAIRLSDGKILIVGGENQNGLIKESEIFNPATHGFITAANLDTARTEHTVTRLADGRVLVIGGRGQAAPLRTTEIYNYNSNVFTPGPALNRPRAGHSATTLADGRILIAGGSADGSAEIYNPATQTFTLVAGGLKVARSLHGAVLLDNGKVLLAGGKLSNGSALNSAELFNPATQTFSATNKPMRGARVNPVLNKLRDGKVQVIGGGEETMEMFNATGEYFTAYDHLPNNAATLKTPGRAALFHNKNRRTAAASEDETASVAALAEAAESSDPTDRESYTVTETGNEALIVGGADSNNTTLASAVEQSASSASVTTDKTDYAPGEIATITGTGFLPNQQVNLLLERDPATAPPTSWTTLTDGAGNFTTTYLVQQLDLNVSFLLTVTGQPTAPGQTEGPVAQTTFTDAPPGGTTYTLSYTASPTTGNVGTCSNIFTVQRLVNGGTDTSGSTALTLSTSGTGTFYSNVGCSSAISGTPPSVSIANGNSTVSFYYQPASGGTHTVTVTGAGGNYSGKSVSTDVLIASPIAQTTVIVSPSPSPVTGTYGGIVNLSATLTKTSDSSAVSGKSISFKLNGTNVGSATTNSSGVATLSNVSLAGINAGTYTGGVGSGVEASFAGDASFGASNGNNTLTVSKATSTTTVTCPASVNYDGTAQTPCSATVTGGGGLSQSLTVSYSNNTNAGTATASASYAGDTNHNNSSDSKNFTVSKAGSTTTVTCPANVTYTGSPLTPCSATVSGAGGLNQSLTVSYSNNTNAGTATASASFPGDANHNSSSDSKNFTIDKAGLTVTASSPTVTYGDSVPTITPSYSGFVSGQNASVLTTAPTCSTAYTAASNAGSAPSTTCSGGVAANYSFTYVPGTVTVNKAPLTVTASSPTVTYGAAVPTITPGYTGFVNGQNAAALTTAPTCTTGYTTASNVGSSPATTCSGGVATNYSFTYVAGAVTVNKAPLTVTALSLTVTYGDAVPTITPSYSGFVNGQNASALTTGPTCTTAYTPTSNAGSSPATNCSGGAAINYSFTYVAGAVTINKASSTTTVTCLANVTYSGAALTPCSAAVAGAGSLNQSLTVNYTNNTSAGMATASANYAGDTNHNSSSDTKNFTIDKAGSTTAVTCSASVIYDGSAQTPCTALVTGAGGLSQSLSVSYSNNTNAGTATASASYAGDSNHSNSSDSKNFTIDKAGSNTALTCPTNVTYTGSALTPCTASVTGVGGLSQSLTVNYSNNTNAGTASASASYAGDTNHNSSSDSKNFTIDKASSVTTLTCPTNVTYDGTAQTPCTASATGAGGLNQSATVSYSSNTNAGTASANASFAGDANHTGSGDSKNFTIDKASSTTTITCAASVTYDGMAQTPCSATATGAGGLNASVTVSYGNNTNAGTATADAAYTSDANHNGSTATQKTFTIAQAGSTTTVTCSASATYNGSAQAPCTAAVTGVGGLNQPLTVNYTNNTNAGTATASATYAGDANHTGSIDSKNFTIDPAPSITIVSCLASVTYNGSAQTPCSATVTGTGGLSLTPTPSYSNNLNAGTATASYTYAGDANHTGSSDSKNFTITQATSTVVVSCPASVTYNGGAQMPCSATYSTSDGLSGSLSVSYSNNTNAGTANASADYAGDGNHAANSDSKNFTIAQANSTTTVSCSASVVYNGSAQTPCTASVIGAGGLSQSLTVNYSNNINAGTATASASYAGDSNHSGSSDTKNFTITQATSTVTVTCPASVTYTGNPQTSCTASYSTSDGLSDSLTVNYTNNTSAGTATASANYGGDANHSGSSNTKNFTIDPASSTTVVSCPANVTYTGAALTPCTVSVTGAGGLNLMPSANHSNNTNVGAATASYTFAGDANHSGSNDTKTFTIDKAGSTTTVTCAVSVTYVGSALTPCTVSVTGAGGLSLTPNASYTNNTNAGTATANYIFVGDANHSGSNDSKNFTINKAGSTTLVSCPASITYTGAALTPCSAVVTGVGALNQAVTVGYSNNVNVGTATASANFAGDANHNGSSDSKTFAITARPTIIAYTGEVTSQYGTCTVNISATLKDGLTGALITKPEAITITVAGVSKSLTSSTGVFVGTIVTNNSINVGTYNIVYSFGGDVANNGLAASSQTLTNGFTVTPGSVGPYNGQAVYTGLNFFWTAGPSSNTATLNLSATLTDTSSPCQGDIRTARVTFAIRNTDGSYAPLSNAQNLQVGLVNPADLKVGTAQAVTQYNLGSQNFASIQLAVIITGNYVRNQSADDTIVGIAKPGIASQMIGVGKLDNLAAPFKSNGFLGNAPATGGNYCTSIASNVAYNKSFTNPQGKVNIIVKSLNKSDGTVDTVVHTYSITSNSISTLTSATVNGQQVVTFGAKCNVVEITNLAAPISLDGGAQMQIVLSPPSGANSQAASITIQKSKGGLWYSSAWDGVKTVAKALTSGLISVQ